MVWLDQDDDGYGKCWMRYAINLGVEQVSHYRLEF
jgi:hypothetical protein